MTTPLLIRLSAHDRMLMQRCVIAPTSSQTSQRAWTAVTHVGGAGASVLAAGLPLLAGGELHQAARLALLTLIVSHLVVQVVKRTVARRRPVKIIRCVSLVREPDCFSFPSGHATAAMSVALAYGLAFPTWAVPLLLLALLIGFSRVRLGVHYPSDVLIGQLIAATTVAVLRAL